MANVLENLETNRGDRVFTLLNRTPELYTTIPAVLKVGAAVGILFPDFGPEAIRQRLEDAGAKVLITDFANLEKIRAVCELLPSLEHILIVGDAAPEETVCTVQIHNFDKLVSESSDEFSPVNVSPDDTCFLIYTSGTTGLPKGVVHRHAIQERLTASAKDILQLEKDDFFGVRLTRGG
ncbi:MAG: AMP-binding protein [Pyrinomonadaceae bacterium]